MSNEIAENKLEKVMEDLVDDGCTEEEAYDYIKNYVRNFYQYYQKDMEEDANATISLE